DDDSIGLAQALTAEPLQVKFPKRKIMKKLLQQSHLAYNYYFLGDVSCESLKLPRSKLSWIIKFNILINKLNDYRSKINSKQYQKTVNKGRKEQVHIRHIYMHINTKN